MKSRLFFLFLAVLSLFTSCEKISQLFPRSRGSEVVFGHSSQRGMDTKASYSGSVDPTSKYERIDWNEGDSISIYCKQASEPVSKRAGYTVKTGGVTSSGSSSSAKLTHNPDSIGLRWGNSGVTHCFSALYPAPGSALSGVAVTENTVTCVLPSVQTYGTLTGTADKVASPNPKYMYLAGYGSAVASDSDGTAVDIFFDPAFTAFEFELQNAYESGNAMTIKSAGITTASDTLLVGTYTVNVTGINSSTGTLQKSNVGKTGLSGKTVSMAFSPALSIAKDHSLTFTLFAQPGDDISKLTFWFIDSGDVKRSFNFKYSDPSDSRGYQGWVRFAAFHKAKITGLVTPESVGLIINMIPIVAPWNNGSKKDVEMDSAVSFTAPVTTWTNDDKGHLIYSD